MRGSGFRVVCSDVEPYACMVILERNGEVIYFRGQAEAEAFGAALQAHDDDGYPD